MSTYPTGDVFCITVHTDRATLDLSYPSGSWERLSERVQIVPADAVVIRRDDLLDVRDVGPGLVEVNHDESNVHNVGAERDAVWHRALAIRHLSVAEYLDAHPPTPPVDEADVEALAADLDEARRGAETRADVIARRLIADGWAKR